MPWGLGSGNGRDVTDNGPNFLTSRVRYATFASQMNAGQAGFFSTVGSFRDVYFYNVNDSNENGLVDPAETASRTCTASSPSTDCAWGGFDIANPASVSSPNHRIGDYSTPLTHEFVLGLDHELCALDLSLVSCPTHRPILGRCAIRLAPCNRWDHVGRNRNSRGTAEAIGCLRCNRPAAVART